MSATECPKCGEDIYDIINEATEAGYEDGYEDATRLCQIEDLEQEISNLMSSQNKINQLIMESSSLEEFADRFELLQLIGVNNIL